ncbi:sensor histidine kinase [Paenibacillus radicis (ex Xue et al. 2023)]|uniref:Histidine kinase n=1 Tax=Paenibacillus radicis (ex Xue et al. 2023) TaxID=2972489 RepID=A0ABT1YPG2_9BACL|nr:sensor histidine kinase [Paenibacillus radicis (ex Xue et al. 2023)]MCR8635063.1 histidine kinase [Paenibacillus radicis (ex Xue et al. 2023)]
MKTKFFIKHLSMFFLPLLIPLIILGTLSILITQNYIKEDINKSSVNLLKQTKENIELILSETDPMSLVYGNDFKIIEALSSIMKNNALSHEELISYGILKSFLSAPANARPYIDSFYIYLPNDTGRFISSKEGLSELNNYYDKEWFDRFIKQDANVKLWIEPRTVKPFAFEQIPTKIVTIYQRINSIDGVIVLNILPAYIENILKSLSTFPEQSILVVNENNQIIFSDKQPDYLKDLKLESINKSEQAFYTVNAAREAYIVTQLSSARYGWKYISIVPQRALYQVPFTIIQITVLLLLISFVLGFVLAFYFTKIRYKQISNIIHIIDSAENGSPLPALPDRVKDEYGYIIQNILKTFIEQSFLKIQLSERRYKLQVAQLTALQAQINPHFLFNTLETLNWETIALTGRPNQVTKIIDNLSEILRYSLTNPEELVSLNTEIKNLKSYIEIQKYRYEDKFDIIWDYDPKIIGYRVMKLLFQPFIENSIYHGIKEKEENCYIKIRIKAVGTELHIGIIDNGLGMNKDTLQMLRNDFDNEKEYSEHIGMRNTNKRLKLAYGEDYGVVIRSKEGYGTAVYMKIPMS